ncbi:MAG: hypothetical protein VKL42_12280 [Snowella sp.]|nr:hypothetical protein [Snowella sp.]
MAQVFSGKVVIPNDQFEAYLQQLVETEKAITPFREQLEKYNQEFGHFLASKYVPKTVRKHTNIVDLFIHFICVYTDVKQINEITKGMVNLLGRQEGLKVLCGKDYSKKKKDKILCKTVQCSSKRT